jgi:type IV secretion system protein VirB6
MDSALQWTIFSFLVDHIEKPMTEQAITIMNAFLTYAGPPLKIALILYVTLTGILIIRGQIDEAGPAIIGRFLKLGIVVWFMTGSGVYQQWVWDLFFTALPQGLINVLSSNGGGTTVNASLFDLAWKNSYTAGVKVWDTTSMYDVLSALVIGLFWLASAISILVCFTIWFVSRIFLALFIIVGPLLVALVLFPATRAIFERWIGSMISCVILQVVTIVFLALVLSVEQQLTNTISTMPASNLVGRIGVLFAGIIFFGMAAFVTLQLPGLASSLSGGLHFHAGALVRTLSDTVSGAAKTASAPASGIAAGMSGATNAAGRAVYQRIRPSPGGSLSDRG